MTLNHCPISNKTSAENLYNHTVITQSKFQFALSESVRVTLWVPKKGPKLKKRSGATGGRVGDRPIGRGPVGCGAVR